MKVSYLIELLSELPADLEVKLYDGRKDPFYESMFVDIDSIQVENDNDVFTGILDRKSVVIYS